MRVAYRLGVTAVLLLAVSATGVLAQQPRIDYSGVYSIAGRNPDGSSYTGSMTVSAFGDGYRVTQVFGADTWSGIGTDIADYFAVAFLVGTGPVISIFRVASHNTLEGFWQSRDDHREGTEVATLAGRRFGRIPSAAPDTDTRFDYAGTYDVSGTNPDGGRYTGLMMLTPFGDGYRATFVSGNDTWLGIATDFARYLAIAFRIPSRDIPSVNIFERQRGGSLAGFWQNFDNPKEGEETATRR